MGNGSIASIEFLLLLLFGFLCLETIKFGSCNKDFNFGCMEAERQALLKFKGDLTDPSGRLSSWVGENCCRWSGVGCSNRTGRVVKLDLRNPFDDIWRIWDTEEDRADYRRSCLGGKINPSLHKLEHLNYLDLSVNNFSGTRIPNFIGSLGRLRHLNLSNALFSGKIPPHLGNLSRLHYLDLNILALYEEELHVDNLQWLYGLSSLKYLDMGGVYIFRKAAADWLHAVNMLPSLLELKLRGCLLENLPLTLPIVNFTSLKILDLSENNFNCSIPHWLFDIHSLENLDLSSNYLRGGIPKNLGNLCKLQRLDLSGNFINGGMIEFVDTLSKCKKNGLERLLLRWNQISGHLPTSLGSLSSLKELDLSNNQMKGTIPESVGQLRQLVVLDLSGNIWEGVISELHFMNLTRLEELSICLDETDSDPKKSSLAFDVRNEWVPPFRLKSIKMCNIQLGTTIPTWLETQESLSSLILTNVGISGSIPNWFWKLSSRRLHNLDLSNNQLNRVPNLLGFCYESIVDLNNNRLEGPIPLWSNVTRLYLTNNLFSGPIPSNIDERMSSLTYLDLSSNRIEGPLPLCSNVTNLYLSNNSFSGHILSNIGEMMPSLISLDLSSNCLEGPLPFSSNITALDLSNNLFSGPLPSNISELLPRLTDLDLSSNSLTGSIPLSIVKLVKLSRLILSNNCLSGQLPRDLKDLQDLWIVDLSNNNLSGKIPSSIGLLGSLELLILSNNNLDGELPFSLQNCTYLFGLDLSKNRFSGNLPKWIGENMTLLRTLDLKFNMFNGSIPQQLCHLSYLHVLDLSYNLLSGFIPSCLGNISGFIDMKFQRFHLYYMLYLHLMVTKGRELQYNGFVIEEVKSLDLSSNNLSGTIPEELTRLSGLSILNLSVNHLAGHIPEKIGDLRWLESLDLSKNQLFGWIPQSMSSLTFLNHLNLSYNNLSGRIPTGNQPQTFDDASIYMGNPKLCGPPFTAKCPGDEIPQGPTLIEADEDIEDGSNMFWFYSGFGSGFVVGFGGVCGMLLLKTSWRQAWFHFFDDMKNWLVFIAVKVYFRLIRKIQPKRNHHRW